MRRSRRIYKTVKALAGDTELATVLLYLTGYGNELDRLIAENSDVLYMLRKIQLAGNNT